MSAPALKGPRVDRYAYWTERPPEPSPRLASWIDKINAGWRPNRRINSLGYDSSAEFYGVYLWEYLNVIYPMLSGK